ncbi:MAG: UPF0179 family protein [Candidatus Bathyarchaeia archaeon]
MVQERSVITLVGVRQAKEGFVFIHQGPSSGCEDCEYYQVCIKNLETGRVYKVVRLREKVFPCKLHEAGVRVVEVVESDILAALPLKLAIEGAVVTFRKAECDIHACEHYELCVPRGLVNGDHCTVLEVGENVACSKGLSLVKAVLRRLPSS